jgi:hypothetical protein
MIKLFWSGLLTVLLLSGCGWDGTATRPNDFATLTSIQIVPASTTIAAGTSTKLTVIGSYSGQFTRDITNQATWSSDNTAVAGFITASSPNRVTGIAPGSAILKATVGGLSATSSLTVSSATIQTVTITPSAPNIAKGLSTQLSASGTFSDATTQDLTFDAAWTSDTTAVATVSDAAASKGLVQGVTVGTATISASFGGIPGTALVTVKQAVVKSIAVTPVNPSILSISSTVFKATGTYSDGTVADISSLVTWSSSQPGFATIADGGAAATLAQGTTLIAATLDGTIGATNLKVTGGNLTGIAVAPADIRLVNGTSVRMTATGTFSNGSSRDITASVDWSVADSTIANVLRPGGNLAWLNALAVTPLLSPTTVSATYKTLVTTTRLTVDAPTLQSITISPARLDLTAGTSGRFTVTGNFSGGGSQDVTYNTTWTSDLPGIAAVGTSGTNKGRVNGVSSGSATITAVYGGLTITAPVTVTARTIDTLTVSGTTLVTSGNQVKFTATALYTDLTRNDVTEDAVWSLPVDKPYVAILADSTNQPGQVVGVDTGSAALTAIFSGKTVSATVTVP